MARPGRKRRYNADTGYAIERLGSRTFRVRLDGRIISGTLYSHDAAHDFIARHMEKNGPDRRRRACLTCGAEFDSEGPHNRMCPRCRATKGTPAWGSW